MRRILIIDDHEIVRSGLRQVLLQLFKPCEVAEAWDEDSATKQLVSENFDLTIMDVQMPNTDALRLASYIRNTHPQNKVLIFSMVPEHFYGIRFLKAGAMGFVSKSAGLDELCKAIEQVLNKRRYINQFMAEELAFDVSSKSSDEPLRTLSSREFEIAQFLIEGKSVGEIAASLSLSVSTVGTYKARIFEKLRVKNVIELIQAVSKH